MVEMRYYSRGAAPVDLPEPHSSVHVCEHIKDDVIGPAERGAGCQSWMFEVKG